MKYFNICLKNKNKFQKDVLFQKYPDLVKNIFQNGTTTMKENNAVNSFTAVVWVTIIILIQEKNVKKFALQKKQPVRIFNPRKIQKI